MNILSAVLSLGLMGLAFGLILAVASKIFYVAIDSRVDEVLNFLPGANCGGCGFSGCAAFAKAVVSGEAKINGCPVGGDSAAGNIAQVMGVEALPTNRVCARILCSGKSEFAEKKYVYNGIDDCVSVSKLAGGDKTCPYGCLGLGTCAKKCPFGAISVADGVAFVDKEKCMACGLCVDTCPRKVIKLVPYEMDTWVGCASKDKGAVSRKYCTHACIGCGICAKNCPSEAITVENNLASIDYEKCTDCGLCVTKCPMKSIRTTGDGFYIPNPEKKKNIAEQIEENLSK